MQGKDSPEIDRQRIGMLKAYQTSFFFVCEMLESGDMAMALFALGNHIAWIWGWMEFGGTGGMNLEDTVADEIWNRKTVKEEKPSGSERE